MRLYFTDLTALSWKWPWPSKISDSLSCDNILWGCVFKGIWVSRGSELDETTLILGNGHFGVTTAQHQELTLLYIDVFYISLWGSLEWCTRCLSNSLRMEHQTCAVPVSSLLVTGQSNTPWALHSDNGEFSCKRSWWERMGQENV